MWEIILAGKKKRATAQEQETLFEVVELKVLEEIAYGDTKKRLVSSPSGKSSYIQLWSSLSKEWRTTSRHNIEENWLKWKKHAAIYHEEQRDRGDPKHDSQNKRKRRVAKKQPGMDANHNNRSKNSKRTRKSPVKNK